MTDSEKVIYNKALDDIINESKKHGLFSTELGYSDVQDYINGKLTEDELWERFEEIIHKELSMVVDDLRQSIFD